MGQVHSMELSENRLSQMLDEVREEHNRSPLAVRDGWYFLEDDDFLRLQLRAVLNALPDAGGVFLDIGTGRGLCPRAVKKVGARSISVDSPLVSGRSALENVAEAGVETLSIVVGEQSIPLPDQSVDCILFADVIEHLANSPKPVLREIWRLLKPGGICVASTPNAVRLTARLKLLFGQSNWPNVFDYYDQAFHGGHHHEYTRDEFRGVFEREGFEIGNLLFREEFLKFWRSVRKPSDLHSGCRHEERAGSGRLFQVGLRVAVSVAALVVNAVPSLRSVMLMTVCKFAYESNE